jgi:hypothetical protein
VDTLRPFLAMFCFLQIPAFAQHLTAENFVSALGFLVFLLNELHKATQHVMSYRAGRKQRKSAPKHLKALASDGPQ